MDYVLEWRMTDVQSVGRRGWEGRGWEGRGAAETLHKGDDALSTKPALSGHSLSLLLGGVPVNPRCQLWPQTAVPPVSRDRCSPDKHYIGNV